MGCDQGDSFPIDFKPNGIPFGSKSKEKLSPRLYPILCVMKWKFSFLSASESFRRVSNKSRWDAKESSRPNSNVGYEWDCPLISLVEMCGVLSKFHTLSKIHSTKYIWDVTWMTIQHTTFKWGYALWNLWLSNFRKFDSLSTVSSRL